MVKKRYIFSGMLICLFLLVVLIGSVYAGDVAYIYKGKTDRNVINFFSSKNIDVDMIKESSLPKDLSGYKMIFVGDENFVKDIPLDYPTVLMNHYIVKKLGLSNSVGVSQLVSTEPLEVNYNGKQIKVYNSAKDSKGIAIPYYYIGKENIINSLDSYLGTYSTSSGSDFGVVMALGSPGDKLANNNILKTNLCFFGISKTEYWTEDTKSFFDSCIKYTYDYTCVPPVEPPIEPNYTIVCSKDSDCGVSKLSGSQFCLNGNVFQNYISFKCNKPGTNESSCTSSNINQSIKTCSIGCNNGECSVAVCSKDSDCGVSKLSGSQFCLNGNVFQNYISFKCNKPGTNESSCTSSNINQSIKTCSIGCNNGECSVAVCNADQDCNDNNPLTEDVCTKPGTLNAGCVHNIYKTSIKLVSFVATPGETTVSLGFLSNNNSLVNGYLVSRDRQNWNLILSPAVSYVFDGLSSSTDYSFYAKALDINNISSDEMNVSVRTLDVPAPAPIVSSGGGGGGGSGGGFSYCSVKWECSDWSVCSNGKQTRTCSVPSGMCKPEVNKPAESQACESSIANENTNPIFSNNDENNIEENPKPENTNPFPITGAVIADTLGKFSWIWIIIALAAITGAYFLVRKFGMKA